MATIERPANLERIVRGLEILAGKPVVRGTRIPVELVLAKLARDPDLDELFADYPRLTGLHPKHPTRAGVDSSPTAVGYSQRRGRCEDGRTAGSSSSTWRAEW